VEGERKYEKDEKREGYFHTERNYGRFCHPSSGALAERCSRARVRFSALGRALARCALFVRIESRDGRLPRKPLDFR
jgi:hypothetical protein